jgi:hypothetical protein
MLRPHLIGLHRRANNAPARTTDANNKSRIFTTSIYITMAFQKKALVSSNVHTSRPFSTNGGRNVSAGGNLLLPERNLTHGID